ncbi:MAG: arginase [Fluviicola sp.]|nr:arginase [Fluviicola sp.]
MKKQIKFLINKSEITAGTRGASLGPEAIMTAARKNGNLLFGEYSTVTIPDSNHLLDMEVKYPFAKRIEGLVQVFEAVSKEVKTVLDEKNFPFVISGDHGSAGGTITGIKAAYPNKRLGVVWIDAHGDLHTPYTTPSGNMHGMPLATAIADDNKQEQKNKLSKEETELWNELKTMHANGPRLKSEDLVFIAVRDTEEQEDALIERLQITNHTVDQVRSKGKKAIMNEILSQLNECDIIYVSFDVDSMDPKHTSHGTGTPVENGLHPEEAEFFLTELAKNKKTVCIEFVEVNPCLDEKVNKMAEVAFDLLEKTINQLEKN